ncbi:MAG: IPT/TIG domain-containing protein [bacterium]
MDPDDDTIYVTDRHTPGKLLAFTPSLTLARQVPVSRQPRGVHSHPTDDTVYVTFPLDDSLSILKGRNLGDSITVRVGDDPYDVAVNPVDDTIYTANYNGKSVSIVAPGGQSVSTVSLAGIGSGVSPLAVAVHPTDDTVYVGGQVQSGLVVASADLSTRTLIPLDGPFAEIREISLSPDGSTIYLATDSNTNRSIALNVTDLDDSYVFTIGPNPVGVAATEWGAYFALNGSGELAVAAVPPTVTSVSPGSGPTAGGTAITITGTGFAAGLTTATIGGTPLLNVAVVNPTTLTATTPARAEGPADVSVTVGSSSALLAGGFTYIPPPPPVPSSEPLDVVAVPGDGSAAVSWAAPASSGSFPVSHYLATSSPGGRTCLTSSLSCMVAGLTNGTAYTFTVQALNGAGWSAASGPSNAVTPLAAARPSITITGGREGKRITVSGSTTGMGMGAILRPWVRLGGQSAYSQGSSQVLVGMDGTFAWSRRTGREASVYMQTPDGSVRSNTVTIR